jgi:arabinan endo-1,5-alpha-L-arabinosidase
MRAQVTCCIFVMGCSGSPDIVARTHDDYDPRHPPVTLELSGDLLAHDPTVIEANGQLFVFYTGSGIPSKVSDDLVNYREGPAVFAENPAWVAELVPGASDLWSPAVAYFAGSYHLYYAASTFASARSCIGHATSQSLGPAASWTDQGPLLCSNTSDEVDDFNAIDPDVILDPSGVPYLAFGSFDSGLKLVSLDASGASLSGELMPIAARPNGGAVQAATLSERGGYYYLFSSFDLCCAGVDSTHRLMVGRSTSLAGPYRDRSGRALLEGGGTLVLESGERWRGPGSNSVLYHHGQPYNIYHAYDAEQEGQATLRIAELAWDSAAGPSRAGPDPGAFQRSRRGARRRCDSRHALC